MKVRAKSKTQQFRRSIRDDAGNILETLEFPPGEPVELDARQFKAVIDDIGVGLVEIDDKGKPLAEPSKQLVAARKAKQAEKAKRIAAKDKGVGEALNENGTPKKPDKDPEEKKD